MVDSSKMLPKEPFCHILRIFFLFQLLTGRGSGTYSRRNAWVKVDHMTGNSGAEMTTASLMSCSRACQMDSMCLAFATINKKTQNCQIIVQGTSTIFRMDYEQTIFKKDFCVANNPCLNGTCEDGPENATCNCFHGYRGSKCEINIDECESQPCENNGTCQDGINQYSCNCAFGYFGSHCETYDPCSLEPCENGGNCTMSGNQYQCDCPDGFIGINCEEPDDCYMNTACQNGATCQDGNHTYSCACAGGFTGNDCQDVDDCYQNNDCLNGATCVDGNSNFSCQCAPGFYQSRCEEVDDCYNNDPCENGGSCVDGNNTVSCTCVSGTTGTNCETNIDECESAPCKNGSTCLDGLDMYECQCAIGFNGTDCDNNIDDCGNHGDACKNDGTCVDGVNSFSCSCQPDWSGSTCEIPCAMDSHLDWRVPENWTSSARPVYYFSFNTTACIHQYEGPLGSNVIVPYDSIKPGKVGNGIHIPDNSVKKWIEIENLPESCLVQGPGTCQSHGGAALAFWINFDDDGGRNIFMASRRLLVRLDKISTKYYVKCSAYNGNNGKQLTAGPVARNSWFHLALSIVVVAAADLDLDVFLDGQFIGAGVTHIFSFQVKEVVEFVQGGLFDITFDEFSLWNGVLTSDQIRLLYDMDK